MYSLLIKSHCVVPKKSKMEVGEAHIPFTSCCYWPNFLKKHGILRKLFDIEWFKVLCWNDITKSSQSSRDILWFNLISTSSFLLMFFLDLKHTYKEYYFKQIPYMKSFRAFKQRRTMVKDVSGIIHCPSDYIFLIGIFGKWYQNERWYLEMYIATICLT